MSGASEALGTLGVPDRCRHCGRTRTVHEDGSPQDHFFETIDLSPLDLAARESLRATSTLDERERAGFERVIGQHITPALAYRALIETCEPLRDGTTKTPVRAAAAWQEMTRGYDVDLDAMMTLFPADGADEIVVVSGIPVYSLCEHHLLPFLGTAAIAYLPANTILGLSKFARIVDAFSRRLQVQERLTKEIADTIEHYLDPRAVAVVIRARHMCMEIRGVQVPGAQTTTSVNRGLFREDARARAEALSLMAA